MNLVEHLEHVIGLIDNGKPLPEIKAAVLAMYEEASGHDQARMEDRQQDADATTQKVEIADKHKAKVIPAVGDLVENMGALWRKSPTGFEPSPYCRHCAGNPIMTPLRQAGIWVCATGEHQAPLSIEPPSA
jgi:hypothetical protein